MPNIAAGRDAINIGNAHANNIVINSGGHFQAASARGSHVVKQDVFRPSFHAPSNPKEVVLDFGDPLSHAEPKRQEAKVLHELLRDDCDQSVARVVTVHGKGGVGKSCILRALAGHEKLKERFPDGIYFLSLGMDAGIDNLIEGLVEMIRLSGGRELGAELRGEDNIRIVLKKVKEWLTGKTCLLLADDFWEENGLGADVVTDLAQIFRKGSGSKVAVTTRFSGVATKGDETVEIKELETTSETAKEILLRYSRCSWNEVDRERVRPAFMKLLRLCSGLPVFLAVVGKGVAKLAIRIKGEKGAVWMKYVGMVEDSELLDTNVDGYKDLGRTLQVSLKVLSQDCGKRFKSLTPYSLCEMHRALCVFKKQAAIPMSVCRCLWKTGSDSAAVKIGNAFADVGLGDIAVEEVGEGYVVHMRLHDLVHIFAMECAKENNEVSRWHERLLEGYISKLGSGELVRRWWNVENKSGEEYLFENLSRHLVCSGNAKELGGLLLSGEWTVFRHKHGGLSAWKHDCSEYLGRKTIVALSDREMEIESAVRMVRDVVIGSWAAVHGNMHEMGLQVFGRLVDCENKSVGKYLESVERLQCGPWLRPMQRLWTRPAEGGMAAEFDVGGYVWDIAVQKDLLIAAAAVGKEVKIIDLKQLAVSTRCIGHTRDVKKVGISADGKRVFSWSEDCTVRQWYVESGKEDTNKCIRLDDEEGDENDKVTCAAFCREKSFVVTGSWKGRVNVWDLSNARRKRRTMYVAKSVKCIDVSANGRTIAAGTSLGVIGWTMLFWDVQTLADDPILPNPTALSKKHLGEVHRIACSPSGRFIASAGNWEDLAVRLWDIENGTHTGDPFGYCKANANRITFSEDGKQIFAGQWGGLIIAWDVTSRAVVRSWKAHSDLVQCVSVFDNGDNRCVVSVGWDRIMRMWDFETAAIVRDARIRHDGIIDCVAASPNGRFFVSASWDRTLRIWDAADGTVLKAALRGHEEGVTCVTVSPDSQRLVSGSWDCTVRVWDVATGAQIGDASRGHKGRVNCVAYSGDGRFVVSGSHDCTARVWTEIDNLKVDESVGEPGRKRVRTAESEGREMPSTRVPHLHALRLKMILQHEVPGEQQSLRRTVTSVAVCTDGRRVLSGIGNGEVWVWDTNCGECIYRAQSENTSCILRIEISRMNQVVTMDRLYEELRWRLHGNGALMRVLENEDEIGVPKLGAQEGSLADGLNSVVCHDRIVLLSDSGKKIATLPEKVGRTAWSYDAQRRVLCAGLRDGRMSFFQVEG